ncbi:MAG TPA: DUF4410 domain-containing protein [Candidatus Binatia bacterium]|nr:DUF4410 domain-containing protein [Candidatus Binatia bacterium]
MIQATRACATVAAILGLSACAKTTVKPLYERPEAALQRPQRILVYDFAVTAQQVQENRGPIQELANANDTATQSEREREIGFQVADRLAEDLVAGIRALDLPAERARRSTPVPDNSLIINGAFLNIDEGNRLRRLVIGFGAGQSVVETKVKATAYALGSYRSVLEFSTHADSGTMPGAAVTMGAGAAAQGGVTAGMAVANAGVSGVRTYRSTVEAAAGRTADQAVAYLSEFFFRQGWIRADQVRDAKLAE